MSRLSTIKPEDATGAVAEVFGAIKKAVGRVPNGYAVIGSHSDDALSAALAFDAAVSRSTLDKADAETIKLVVSQAAGCNYCLAAHKFIGKMSGLTPQTMKEITSGSSTGDAKRDALVQYVETLISTRGEVATATIDAIRQAGYTERQLIEINLAIASITFSNLVNRVNDTTIDFPAVD
ncbi:carboxymuconolactone decarboxylase family protein [Paraburkholderia oxyphila]|uniref:carboxymuconolactone decarboxylase family protein n=1 Tax=Paraburkholderia oxyphila TaxID=614212 RepID=UPI00047F69D7|nr:carboxymuconolactone decarboxylase family protein [Paraburkholderia oxyphila]